MQDLFVPNDYDLAARMSEQELKALLHVVQTMSFFTKVLDAMPELVGVMTPTRQIVFANKTMLVFLDLESGALLHGPRPGELVGCINSAITPGGCGTAPACKQCGALRTIMDAITSGHRASGECRITCQHEHGKQSLDLFICCAPFQTQGLSFNLLMAQDISDAKRRSALERVFFHDVGNSISALKLNAQMLATQSVHGDLREFAERIQQLAVHLDKEVQIQKVLSVRNGHTYEVSYTDTLLRSLVVPLQELFAIHPVALHKTLHLGTCPDLLIRTDPDLVQRILINMLINAFEDTPEQGQVRLWAEETPTHVTFAVWNRQAIEPKVARRVFQRHFSTKPGAGRGLGTYAMKLFGETYLKGTVHFTSSPDAGTTFRLQLSKVSV